MDLCHREKKHFSCSKDAVSLCISTKWKSSPRTRAHLFFLDNTVYKTCLRNVESYNDYRPSICFVDVALDFKLLAFVSDCIFSHSLMLQIK